MERLWLDPLNLEQLIEEIGQTERWMRVRLEDVH